MGIRQGPELHPSLISPDETDHGSADPFDDKVGVGDRSVGWGYEEPIHVASDEMNIHLSLMVGF